MASFLCKWFGIGCPKPQPPQPPQPPASRYLSTNVEGPADYWARLVLDIPYQGIEAIAGVRLSPEAPWHISFSVDGAITCGANIEIVSNDGAYQSKTVRLSVNGKTVDELGGLPRTDAECDPVVCEPSVAPAAPRRN